jgi:RNA polymerase sigma-70 factor (ECF subfamily)
VNLNEEKELIEKAKKDPEAFGKIYDENYPKIFGYILKRVADIEIAKDITSQTFLKALKNIWKFKWRNISISAWLYRIANNEIANFFRKKREKSVSLEKVLEPISHSNPFNEIVVAQEQLQKQKDFLKAQKEISRLRFRYQEVITLRFFEKKKIKEISEILGKKEGTVKSLIHRALKKLKKKLDATN